MSNHQMYRQRGLTGDFRRAGGSEDIVKRFFVALLAVASGAMGTGAATDTSGVDHPAVLADSIVVTANRFGLTENRSVWPVLVVKPVELKTGGGLEAVLEGKNGLDIRNYNGYGSLTTLSNWGVFNRHMLLLYNGRVVKDYSLGGFNLADFSADEFERIEILKGPQSAFYGSDAVGGVVNLISKNAFNERIDLTVRRGSLGYEQYIADLSHRLGKVALGTYAELSQADNRRDNAGVDKKVLSLHGDYYSDDARHQVMVSGRYFTDSLGVPGPDPFDNYIPVHGSKESNSIYDHQEDENYSIDIQYRFTDTRFGTLQCDVFWEKKNIDYNSLYNYQAGYFTIDSSAVPVDSVENVDSVDVYSRYLTTKRSMGVSGRYLKESAFGYVAGGVDWLSGSVSSTTGENSVGTNIVGPFAPFSYTYESFNYWEGRQDQVDMWSNVAVKVSNRFRIDLSGRLQFVQGRSIQPSHNLGGIWDVTDEIQFKVGYAYAYRLPSISEQYAEEVFTRGNSELNPETSRSLIASVVLGEGRNPVSGRLTLFHQTIDSLIQYQFDAVSFKYVPRSVNEFRTTGLDFGVSYRQSERFRLDLDGVYQRGEQTLDGNGGFVDAFYVPDLKGRLSLSGGTGRLVYGATVNYTSDRLLVRGGETVTIDAVYELGASVSYRFYSGLTLSLTGHDLTDERRPDQFGFSQYDHDYPSVGRTIIVGISYSAL